MDSAGRRANDAGMDPEDGDETKRARREEACTVKKHDASHYHRSYDILKRELAEQLEANTIDNELIVSGWPKGARWFTSSDPGLGRIYYVLGKEVQSKHRRLCLDMLIGPVKSFPYRDRNYVEPIIMATEEVRRIIEANPNFGICRVQINNASLTSEIWVGCPIQVPRLDRLCFKVLRKEADPGEVYAILPPEFQDKLIHHKLRDDLDLEEAYAMLPPELRDRLFRCEWRQFAI